MSDGCQILVWQASVTQSNRTKEAAVTVTVPDNPAEPYHPGPQHQPLIGVVRWLVTVILLAQR